MFFFCQLKYKLMAGYEYSKGVLSVARLGKHIPLTASLRCHSTFSEMELEGGLKPPTSRILKSDTHDGLLTSRRHWRLKKKGAKLVLKYEEDGKTLCSFSRSLGSALYNRQPRRLSASVMLGSRPHINCEMKPNEEESLGGECQI